MPYCPKCDMEFIEGMTTCTDCGGPLYANPAAARAAANAEKLDKLRRYQERLEEVLKEAQENAPEEPVGTQDVNDIGSTFSGLTTVSFDQMNTTAPIANAEPEEIKTNIPQPNAPRPVWTKAYVDSKQKYEDVKSSAVAFLVMGVVMSAGAIVMLTNILNLQIAASARMIPGIGLAFMGVFGFLVYFQSLKQVKELQPELEREKERTAEIINWFTETYTAADIDKRIRGAASLSEEEISLDRFRIIQELIVTGKNVLDASYLDMLCEEIYSKLFDN